VKHIDLTSQVTRHQLLMDLAKAVVKHVEDNPHPEQQHDDAEYTQQQQYTHHSSK
jgi:hypothetical protein